jgi:hypothetical protein
VIVASKATGKDLPALVFVRAWMACRVLSGAGAAAQPEAAHAITIASEGMDLFIAGMSDRTGPVLSGP